MLDKWNKVVDNHQAYGTLLTDFSKAFDCVNHDLLIAKLLSYGISLSSSKLLADFLKNRKQRTKVESSYSPWDDIEYGITQGSTSGPLLFNIFLCDLFLILDKTYFTTYADDNTPHTVQKYISKVVKPLEEISKALV